MLAESTICRRGTLPRTLRCCRRSLISFRANRPVVIKLRIMVLVHAETYWHPRLGERTQGNKGIIQVFEITRSDIRWFEPRDVELDEHRHLPEVLKQIARWHDGTSNCIVGTTELTVVTFPDTIDDTNASRLFFRGEPLDLRRAIYHQDADVN